MRRLVASCFRLEKIINLEHADAFQEDVLAYPAIILIVPDVVEHELLLPALNAKDLRGNQLNWHGGIMRVGAYLIVACLYYVMLIITS